MAKTTRIISLNLQLFIKKNYNTQNTVNQHLTQTLTMQYIIEKKTSNQHKQKRYIRRI